MARAIYKVRYARGRLIWRRLGWVLMWVLADTYSGEWSRSERW